MYIFLSLWVNPIVVKKFFLFSIVDQYILKNFEPSSYDECATACQIFGPIFNGRLLDPGNCVCGLCREDFWRIALDPNKEKYFLKYSGCGSMDMIQNIASDNYPMAVYVCKRYL